MNKIKEYLSFLFKPTFFVISLIIACYIVLYLEKLRPSDFGHYSKLFEKEVKISKKGSYPLREKSALTLEELEAAKIAWKYFENNYHPETGMINGSDLRPYFTFSDLSAYLLGLLSAYELNIIDSIQMDKKLSKALFTLNELPLYRKLLPNKKYNSINLKMYNHNNEYKPKGSGWSAIDLGRFFVFVNKVKNDYHHYFPSLKMALKRWKMNEMLIDGFLYGITEIEDEFVKVQEGLLGYEEYCARGLGMCGFDASQASEYTDFIRFVKLNNVEIAVDTREVKMTPGFNYIIGDPYVFEGVELGWNVTSAELAYRIFQAQKSRFNSTHIITCCGEEMIDKTPFYSYNALYANRKSWQCFTPLGFDAGELKTVSTKNAFGWYVLYKDDYSDLLFNNVKYLYDAYRGWYSGKYENSNKINKTITAVTNGFVLEALNYKQNGPLVKLN